MEPDTTRTRRGLPWKTTEVQSHDLSHETPTTRRKDKRVPSSPKTATPTYTDVHTPVPTRPVDPIVTDSLGNSYLVDQTTGVSLPLPKLDRGAVTGLLARELTRYSPNTNKTNIELILENLVEMAKTHGKVGLDATNTVLDRILGKPIQETKNFNANVNAETLDDLLDAIGPRQSTQPGPASSQTRDMPADFLQDVS